MMNLSTPYRTAALLASLLLATACTDKLTDESNGLRSGDEPDGIAFSLNVKEQAELDYQWGSTRADGGMGGTVLHDPNFGPRPVSGEVSGLQLYALSLPLVGIHPYTVGTADNNGTDPATRATTDDIIAAGAKPINFHDSLTVWGYAYNGDGSYTRQLFDKILLKKIRGWRSFVHWPYDDGKATKMRFYAIAPSMESLDLQVQSDPAYDKAPTFRYKVPDLPNNEGIDQRDLLYGESGEISVTDGPPGKNGDGKGEYEGTGSNEKEQHLGDDDKAVNLTFKHLLTTVRFAQGKIPLGVTIKGIKITGVKNGGTYKPDVPDEVVIPAGSAVDPKDEGYWDTSGSDDDGVYSLTTDWTSKQFQYTSENVYIDGGQVLFLMPQNLGPSATLSINCDIDIHERDAAGNYVRNLDGSYKVTQTRRNVKLTTTLDGGVWKKGYTVTYLLSLNKVAEGYYLLIDPTAREAAQVNEHSTATSSNQFTIHSYRYYLKFTDGDSTGRVNPELTSVPWHVTGFSDTKDGTYTTEAKPAWLTSITGLSGPQDGGQGRELKYELSAQERFFYAAHKDVLSTNTTVTGTFDLSWYTPNGTAGGDKRETQETANCYIVNAPGTYSFPIVYGNAIGSGAGLLGESTLFRDHQGRSIREAFVDKQNKYSVDEDVTSTYNSDHSTAYLRVIKTDIVDYGYISRWAEHGDIPAYVGDLTAELLWQDNPDVTFSNLAFTEDPEDPSRGNKIQFTLSDNIAPCNAVIALKGRRRQRTTYTCFNSTLSDAAPVHTDDTDKGTFNYDDKNPTEGTEQVILWTWHIWVTDDVYPNTANTTDVVKKPSGFEGIVLATDALYPSYSEGTKLVSLKNTGGTELAKIMPVNLGWMSDAENVGKVMPRSVWVKVEQTEPSTGDKQAILLNIQQNALQTLVTSKSTVYQWGRPTALPMPREKVTLEKGVPELYRLQCRLTTAEETRFVSSPVTQLYDEGGSGSWWGVGERDYWGGPTKTLYDPCPPGFRVPDGSIFMGFSLTGADLKAADEGGLLNTWSSLSCGAGFGAYIYAHAHHETIPASDRNGQIYYVPASGHYLVGTDKADISDGLTDKDNAYFWTRAHSGSNGRYVFMKPVKNPSEPNVFLHDATLPANTLMPIRPVLVE